MKIVNQSYRKKDAMQLVTGQPVYTDDQCSAEVKHCVQQLVFYFNQRQRLVDSLFR